MPKSPAGRSAIEQVQSLGYMVADGTATICGLLPIKASADAGVARSNAQAMGNADGAAVAAFNHWIDEHNSGQPNG
jgi:hypothetical protein